MIVCPPQINDFCDFLGTPDAPVSKIVSVRIHSHLKKTLNVTAQIIPSGNTGDKFDYTVTCQGPCKDVRIELRHSGSGDADLYAG